MKLMESINKIRSRGKFIYLTGLRDEYGNVDYVKCEEYLYKEFRNRKVKIIVLGPGEDSFALVIYLDN